MYDGYLALGDDVPYTGERFELINTGRVGAYIETWNNTVRQGSNEFGKCISWYDDCDECFTADLLFTNGEGYLSPQSDPAPWYDPNVRDSEAFFGVVGLEITGAEDSTRSATVTAAVAGGGAVSRLRFGPRTIVVRGLAVAADSCGLEVGLNWLRCQYEQTTDDCGNDHLWFLDCCPACQTDPNAPPAAPCWPDTYNELNNGPADCPADTWWPSTYTEFNEGPNPDDLDPSPHPEWCSWVVLYRQIPVGLPQFSCDVQGCLVPYIRNFQQVRVIEGPIVLNRQSMHGQGEIAEIEFTIACGDPHEYTPTEIVVTEELTPSVAVVDSLPVVNSNPFNPPSNTPRGPQVGGVSMPTEWLRAEFELPGSGYPKRLQTTVPAITIAPGENMGVTRVGVWDGDDLIGGYSVPFIPSGGLVDVDAVKQQTITEYDGELLVKNGFARSYTGQGSVTWPELVTGKDYLITVDQAANDAVTFDVEVQAAEKGCA